jgi:stress-induced morphogen
MKKIERISLILFAVSFLTAVILSTCEKKSQPQDNQEEQRLKAQKDSIEKARYYEWLYGGSEPDTTERKGGKYHYEVTITDAQFQGKRYRHRKYDANLINGTYIWNMDTYLATYQEWFDYILDHLQEMQKYKVSNGSYSKELEYYDEHFDDYHDDPEDGITYPDDIFDYLDD